MIRVIFKIILLRNNKTIVLTGLLIMVCIVYDNKIYVVTLSLK